MKNYFQKSIKKFMLSDIYIYRYDYNIKKISNKESAKPKGRNRGRTILNSMFESILQSLNLNSKIELLLLIF